MATPAISLLSDLPKSSSLLNFNHSSRSRHHCYPMGIAASTRLTWCDRAVSPDRMGTNRMKGGVAMAEKASVLYTTRYPYFDTLDLPYYSFPSPKSVQASLNSNSAKRASKQASTRITAP